MSVGAFAGKQIRKFILTGISSNSNLPVINNQVLAVSFKYMLYAGNYS